MSSTEGGWNARVLDRVEQVASVILLSGYAYRMWPESNEAQELVPLLMLATECLLVFFLLIRRPSENISLRIQDWIVAFVCTTSPLLVLGEGTAISLPVGGVLILIGLIAQVAAKLSLNRSFGLVAANRGVKTRGAYHFVRHPMYFGYIIAQLGFLLVVPRVVNLILYVTVWALLVLRINMEERVLSQDESYRDFQKSTPWRLFPGIY